MKFLRVKVLITAAIFAVAASTAALADSYTLTLNNPNQTYIPGVSANPVEFTGNFTGNADNIVGSELVWTTATPSCDAGECLTGDSFFLMLGPQTNAAGFFDIFIDLSVGPGLYSGRYELLDGDGVAAFADFNITVNTPEPGSLALLGSGLLGLGGVIRRKLIA